MVGKRGQKPGKKYWELLKKSWGAKPIDNEQNKRVGGAGRGVR